MTVMKSFMVAWTAILAILPSLLITSAQAQQVKLRPPGWEVSQAAGLYVVARKLDWDHVRQAKQCSELRDGGLGGWSFPTAEQARALDDAGFFEPIKKAEPKFYVFWLAEDQIKDRRPINFTWNLLAHRQVSVWQGFKASMVCVTDGKTKAAAAEPAKTEPVQANNAPTQPQPTFGLTRVGPKEPTTEEIAARKKLEADAAQRAANEQTATKALDAKVQAEAKAKEDAARVACMKPEARGQCSCARFFPENKGLSCSR